MSKNSTPQIIEMLSNAFKQAGLDAQIQIRRTSLGWMNLTLISSAFQGKSQIERERQIDEILETIDLNLGGYPFLDYMLYTPQEVPVQEEPQPIQLPLWSEILMAPEPEHPAFPSKENVSELDEDRTLVVTFYSFKGGVGRSTALGLVANLLVASGHRVAMLDFDLEAPGISFMFPSSVPGTKYGVLDYVYQRYLIPEENNPPIADCICRVDTPFRGELYLVPAGEFNEGYIHKLADLDVRLLYNQEHNPLQQLLEDVKAELEPDVILIDARTGFTEMGAIALFDQADLGIICFTPTNQQNFEGLKWVVKAASKQRSYKGIPDLRFLLTPMPTAAESQHQLWVTTAAERIAEYWEAPSSVSIDELYYEVPYNPNIITLTNLAGNIQGSILDPYRYVADTITASLPEKEPSAPIAISDNRQTILTELKFSAHVAQDMDSTKIPDFFQRTDDFTKFLQDRIWLVTGAKGTGKTFLFRLFVESSDAARKLARPVDLQNVDFIPGHGSRRLRDTLLASADLESYEQQAGTDKWPLFWLNYMLVQLVISIPALQQLPFMDPQLVSLCQQETRQRSQIINWLVSRTTDPRFATSAYEALDAIDRWFVQQNRKAWLLYDELDGSFGQDPGRSYQQNYARRRRALEALMGWWLENGPALKNIIPKILLREDIWGELNFTNKAHLSTRIVQLQWEEDDLWRMVLRQALQDSHAFTVLVQEQSGIDGIVDRLNQIDLLSLRACLYPLWGERMGRTNKAYTYNWVRKRISDSKPNRFPRSLIELLQKSIEIEKKTIERNPYESVLRPRSLIDALPFVSSQRVIEVKNEYPEFVDLLDKLRDGKSPIALNEMGKRWKLENDINTLRSHIKGMIDAGILAEYQPRLQEHEVRYSVAEIYLYGLGMIRQGAR